jgi:hypothetical protein
MNVEKKKQKFLNRFNNASCGQEVKVVTFKRHHFNAQLSTSIGFGYQDMKDDAKELYKWLLANDYKVITIPDYSKGTENFRMIVSVKKTV